MPIILLILLAVFATTGIAAWSFAPWVPMWKKDLVRVMRLADLQPGEVFYDLGCGDGRVVLEATRIDGVKAIGIELAMPLYAVCQLRRLLTHSRARFRYGNLFHQSLADADVIYVFGMPASLADRLKKKIETECRPGTRIISYVFLITGWTPESHDRPTETDNSLYRYIIS